jgi:osmotically-inducible protein OsmY
MRTPKQIVSAAFVAGLILGGGSLGLAQSSSTQPDNTAVNKRDQKPSEVTADQQKINSQDRDLTSKIRKAIVDDKSLSTYAHNVKVVSQAGTVTLKGPVRSEEEIKSIMAKATEITGSSDRVVNQLSVKPKS